MSPDLILQLLLAERDRLNKAIEALQGSAKRRGRPPKNSLGMIAAETAKRRPFSSATRKKMAEAQRRRWAATKKPSS